MAVIRWRRKQEFAGGRMIPQFIINIGRQVKAKRKICFADVVGKIAGRAIKVDVQLAVNSDSFINFQLISSNFNSTTCDTDGFKVSQQ